MLSEPAGLRELRHRQPSRAEQLDGGILLGPEAEPCQVGGLRDPEGRPGHPRECRVDMGPRRALAEQGPEHRQRVDAPRIALSNAAESVEPIVVRVRGVGRHRRHVAEPPDHLLAERSFDSDRVDETLLQQKLATERALIGAARVVEFGQRAIEHLGRHVPELDENLTEVRDGFAHVRLGGLARHEQHGGQPPVRRHDVHRARELLVEGVDQKMEQWRLRERSTRGRPRSLRSYIAHLRRVPSSVP